MKKGRKNVDIGEWVADERINVFKVHNYIVLGANPFVLHMLTSFLSV